MEPTNQFPNDDKIIFKTDKHSTIISENLQTFYEENEFFDTIIKAGIDCVNINAHKVVLCSLSEYFLHTFRATQTTSKENILELKEIKASTLKLVIDFMYSGAIEMSLATVEELLRTASFLKLKTLIDGCCELIEKNINLSNSLYWFRLAHELSLSGLKDKSLECTYTHFEKISKEKELMMLNENELKDLLFNDNPHGDFEEEVFLSMVAWINYDKLNREHLVFELLSMVRFWVLSPKFIIENRHSVCKTVESYELICGWLQWHLSPETRSNDYSDYAFRPRKKPKLAFITSYCSLSRRKIIIETFNPKTNSWSEDLRKNFDSKIYYFASIVIDGKLIIVGGKGRDEWKNTVECYDIDTFEYKELPPMINTPNQRCKLVDLKGHLCVFADGKDTDTVSMEMYSFSTRKWQNLNPICQPSKTSQIAAHNGILYILDFNNGFLQTYNASTNKWTSRTIKTDSLNNFGLAAVEGFLYVFGGCNEKDDCSKETDEEYVKSVQRYDLTNDQWCEMAPLPYEQATSYIQTKVLENKIIACDNVNISEYDPDTNTWSTMPPITDSVWNFSFDIYNCYN
ncbi:kelch-like protein 28 [Episyrphus balteatus]|uniref:kelch-like protein 28 n=1 Tax=Episyrphus balteatus TaxID=286459 RepID=UPI0024862E55|nr:kelch-like protein 28 [Episyrphus balteatus]